MGGDGFRFAPSVATLSTSSTTPDLSAFEREEAWPVQEVGRSPREQAASSFESSIRSLHGAGGGAGGGAASAPSPTSPKKQARPELAKVKRNSSWLGFRKNHADKGADSSSGAGEVTPKAHANGSPAKQNLAAKLRGVLH